MGSSPLYYTKNIIGLTFEDLDENHHTGSPLICIVLILVYVLIFIAKFEMIYGHLKKICCTIVQVFPKIWLQNRPQF